MKSFRIAIVGLLACAIAACTGAMALQTASSIISGVSSPAVQATSTKVVLEGTRGLILANNAYQAAAGAVTPFVRAGRFNAAQLDRIEALNNKAYDLLNKADGTLTAAQRAAGVFAIVDELNRMIGK